MRKITFEQLPEAVAQILQKLDEIEIRSNQESPIQHQQNEDRLMTLEECATFLHLSKTTIYKHIQNGELPVMKRFGQNYFLKSELIEYLKAGRKRTNTEIVIEAEEALIKSRR